MVDFDPDAYLAGKVKTNPFDAALAAEGVTGRKADFIKSIYQQESGSGANTKTSNAGATGGMQIIPATFNGIADKGWNINNPEHNMRAGIRYASQGFDASGGDPALAGAYYYGGPGGMRKASQGIAVSDPRNPNAPTTLQYGQQVASRMPTTPSATQPAVAAFDPDAYLASKAAKPVEMPAEKSYSVGGFLKSVGEDVGNITAGLVRGSGSIGATILAPYDMAKDAINGKGFSLESNRERRAGIDGGLQAIGADTDSYAYKGGKLAGEIAGTAGAGGVVANGLLRAAPAVSSVAPTVANVMTKAAPAIQSGGLSLGSGSPTNALSNILVRTGGGAVNGAVSAGLANPNDIGTGAMVGGLLPGGVKLAGAAGSMLKNGVAGTTNHVLGMATGTGAESVRTAYQSGKSGATGFLDNMRGNVPMTDVLDSAKSALGQMRLDRAAQYKSGMAGVSADKTVIDFAPIDKAVAAIQTMGNYKGQVINKNSAGVVDEISGLVSQWKSLNPAEYHTPEGLDALKQAISDVRDTTQFGTAARKAADSAYNAVKGEITAQAPTYSKVMQDYSEASTALAEVEKALSLGNKTSADTAMRKLQSLMRNNVNTNYGNRLGLAKTLEDNGADLLAPIAGQAMSSYTPRGLSGLAASGGGIAALATNPLALAALPATSPRLVGEMAYKLGSVNRGFANAGGAAANRLAQLAGRNSSSPITMNQLAPLLATVPVLAANQR